MCVYVQNRPQTEFTEGSKAEYYVTNNNIQLLYFLTIGWFLRTLYMYIKTRFFSIGVARDYTSMLRLLIYQNKSSGNRTWRVANHVIAIWLNLKLLRYFAAYFTRTCNLWTQATLCTFWLRYGQIPLIFYLLRRI